MLSRCIIKPNYNSITLSLDVCLCKHRWADCWLGAVKFGYHGYHDKQLQTINRRSSAGRGAFKFMIKSYHKKHLFLQVIHLRTREPTHFVIKMIINILQGFGASYQKGFYEMMQKVKLYKTFFFFFKNLNKRIPLITGLSTKEI